MSEILPANLTEYIVLNIDSVELLEVLALLHSQSDRAWTITELNEIIRSSDESIHYRLEYLTHLRLAKNVSEDGLLFQYSPNDDRIRAIGDALVLAYHTRRVEVIELIYTKPIKEITSFSNAFKFRWGLKKDG